MAFNDIKEDISKVRGNVKSYIDYSVAYYKLKIFKILMRSITSIIQLVILGFILVIAFILLSFAASIGLGILLNNQFLGYLIVGGFYLLLAGIFYIKRSRIERNIIMRFSDDFFEETD